ncbi:MAG: ATP-binding protein [Myxococcota bacterium]
MIGFLAVFAVCAVTALFVFGQLERIRDDLRLVHRGYLAMARQAAQLRTLQEAKEEYVRRALEERDAEVRRHLVGYAREFYPRALRDRLREMSMLTIGLAAGPLPDDTKHFLGDLQARLEDIALLHDQYDEATLRLLVEVDVEVQAEAGDRRQPDVAAPPREPDGIEQEDGPPLADSLAQKRTARADTYATTGEVLSREVRAVAMLLEGRIGEALLRSERIGRQASWVSVVLFGVALAIGGGVLFSLSRSLRPLRMLLDSARAIRRGSLNVEVETQGNDEVSELAREFNAMARSLQDRERVLSARGEELLRLKAFSDDVIRSVRIGIVILDSAGTVKGLNPAARSVFQLPLIDLEGRSLRELDDLSAPLGEVLACVGEVHAGGELRSFPLVQVKERVIDVALVPIRDRSGVSLDDVLLLGEDVTQREHTRERLLRSERLAAIGRLAAQITHEIRNPLSSIGLNIELLGDDIDFLPEARQAEARQILDAVGREVARLTQITEGYLRYARLPEPHPVGADVGDLLADLCAFSQSEAARAGVMLELQIDDTLPQVPLDAPRLRQALLNLLKNAQEAAGPGGTVRCSARAAGANGVIIVVEDSGPGVPEELRKRLFEPFFTTKQNGTGLGLALTREIVSEHGGTLEVERSSLGGASFRVELTAARATETRP